MGIEIVLDGDFQRPIPDLSGRRPWLRRAGGCPGRFSHAEQCGGDDCSADERSDRFAAIHDTSEKERMGRDGNRRIRGGG